MALPADALLFSLPKALDKVFNRDLAAAGIPKQDARDRFLDVHALRMTFGTHLSAAGVPLRTAQAAMRHSDPKLTANVYTDPQLLDVGAALDKLPGMAAASLTPERQALAAGAESDPENGNPFLAPVLALAPGFSCTRGAIPVTSTASHPPVAKQQKTHETRGEKRISRADLSGAKDGNRTRDLLSHSQTL